MLKDKEKALVRALSRHCGILRRFFDRSSDYTAVTTLCCTQPTSGGWTRGWWGLGSHCDAVTRADPGPAS